MSLANKWLALVAASTLLAGGCATQVAANSIVLPGLLADVTSGPLAGDFSNCKDLQNLKKGTSTDVVYFQYYLPWATIGNETLQKAMKDGGITKLVYADYSVKYILVIGFYKVTAYGT